MAYDEKLAERIRLLLQDLALAEEKKMFGGVGFLVNGNMACGVNGARLIARLDPAEYEEALAKPHVRMFDMTGRPMKGWVMVEPAGVEWDADLRKWLERSLHYVLSLPPK
ncbi:TfoX/Sxy family protein [bacterium]|nr:MAG: TfoX/Sxy family protein [bacterium]